MQYAVQSAGAIVWKPNNVKSMKPIEKYRLELTIGHADGRYDEMTFLREECMQIISRDRGCDDWDFDTHETPEKITVTVESEKRTYEVARLIETDRLTNEEESREILEVLGMDIAGTGDLSDALSDLTENTESTYRIIRSAIEVLCDVTDLDEPAMFHTCTQRAVFIARAMLRNIVK
jgi:hypothetical protein